MNIVINRKPLPGLIYGNLRFTKFIVFPIKIVDNFYGQSLDNGGGRVGDVSQIIS